MVIAIFSDEHANHPAIQAVQAVLDRIQPRQAISLGDVFGYGPSPIECYEAVERIADVSVRGNHDQAMFDDEMLGRFGDLPKAIGHWTRSVLANSGIAKRFEEERYWPTYHYDNNALYTHAFPSADASEIVGRAVYPYSWLENDSQIDALLNLKNVHIPEQRQGIDVAFVGHNHCPFWISVRKSEAVYTWDNIRCEEPQFSDDFLTEEKVEYILPEDRYCVVSVGSVGQPRDLDPRICLVLYTPQERRVEYLRIPYDLEAARLRVLGKEEEILRVARSRGVRIGGWRIRYLADGLLEGR